MDIGIYVRLQSLSKTLQLVFATKRYHVGVSNIFYMSNDDYQLARLLLATTKNLWDKKPEYNAE